MKWLSTKTHRPSISGNYIVRFIEPTMLTPELRSLYFDGDKWLDFDKNDHLFQHEVTHFCIPDPVEIED
jgi:hypothetical protein